MRINKKLAVAAAAVSIVAIGAGSAVAYWTTSGNGNGAGAAGTTNGVLSVLTTTSAGTLYPVVDLAAGQTVSGNFSNTNGSSVRISNLTVSIGAVTGPNISEATPCAASNFAVTGGNLLAAPQVIATGDANGSWTHKLALVNNADLDQNGCKDASVALSYSVS